MSDDPAHRRLPDGVVGLQAIGEVDSADYRTIATPAVERALERRPRIRLIHVLDERFARYTPAGAWQDALFGLGHLRSFERIAIVTDSKSMRRLVELGGWSIPGEVKRSPTGSAGRRRHGPARAWAN